METKKGRGAEGFEPLGGESLSLPPVGISCKLEERTAVPLAKWAGGRYISFANFSLTSAMFWIYAQCKNKRKSEF